MSVEVKICGLSTPGSVDAAIAAGADYIGLVLYPPSPRHVSLETARALAARARGKARIVALLVDPTDTEVDGAVAAIAPDLLQLHGSESPARVAAIRARSGCPVMKAIKVRTDLDVRAAAAYRAVADLLLFDAAPPAGRPGALPGGNGVPFDWRMLAASPDLGPYMLSGGLTPETAAAAAAATGAAILDVSSGVETAPGRKDPELIRRFIANAKGAHTAR